MSPICYFFLFFLQTFAQLDRVVFLQSGRHNTVTPQKLDKSGKPVYTSPSFPIGNKSYKLFSFRKTPRYRPSKTREDWHGRPFLRRYLILKHMLLRKAAQPQGPVRSAALCAGRRCLHQLDRHRSRKRRVYSHRSGGRRHRAERGGSPGGRDVLSAGVPLQRPEWL